MTAEDSWYAHVVEKADTLAAEDAVGWLTAAIAETGGTHAKTADLTWRLGLAHSEAGTGLARRFLQLASELAAGPFKDIVLLDLFLEGLFSGEVDDESWDAIDNPWMVGANTVFGPGNTAAWPVIRAEAKVFTGLEEALRPLRKIVRTGGLCHGDALLAGYTGLAWLIEAEHPAERLVEDWLHGLVRVRIDVADDGRSAAINKVIGGLRDPEPFREAVRAVWSDGRCPW